MGIYDREYYRRDGPSFLGSFSDRGKVCKWLEIDPRPRGAVRFRFGDGSELRGVIHELDPRRRLGLRWRDVEHAGDPTTVVFELHPTEEGTRLVVTESRGLLAADLWVETVG